MAHIIDRDQLLAEVTACIAAGKEGEWWDFKQEWHSSMKELVKDIVCFANTAHDRDCYLIIGVADDRRVTGMKKPRRKQADILEAMSHVPFAGAYFPLIEVVTLVIEGKEVDVLVIFDSDRTPFYLDANYGPMDKGCIYVRVGDKNTASHGNADIHDIERLWRKRFALTREPLDYMLHQLRDRSLWQQSDTGFYHRLRPEYTLVFEEGSGPDTPLTLTQMPPTLMHKKISFMMGQTELAEYPILVLGGNLCIPAPDLCSHREFSYPFYIRGTAQETLLQFLCPEKTDALSRVMEAICVFASASEHEAFERYLQGKRDSILIRFINEARYHTVEPAALSDKLRLYLIFRDLLAEFRKETANK